MYVRMYILQVGMVTVGMHSVSKHGLSLQEGYLPHRHADKADSY